MTSADLRTARKSLGLTQEQMAGRLFLSRWHYNALENSKHPITKRVSAMVEMLLKENPPLSG